jgi:hypothetical protein
MLQGLEITHDITIMEVQQYTRNMHYTIIMNITSVMQDQHCKTIFCDRLVIHVFSICLHSLDLELFHL